MAGNQVTNGPGSHVLATGHTFMARLTPNSANIIIRAMHLVAALFINELDQGVLANPTYYAVPFSLLNNQMTKDHSRFDTDKNFNESIHYPMTYFGSSCQKTRLEFIFFIRRRSCIYVMNLYKSRRICITLDMW